MPAARAQGARARRGDRKGRRESRQQPGPSWRRGQRSKGTDTLWGGRAVLAGDLGEVVHFPLAHIARQLKLYARCLAVGATTKMLLMRRPSGDSVLIAP